LQAHAFDSIPQSELLGWCEQKPEIRYPVVAAGVTAFQADETGCPRWTKTARKILDKAPNPVEVLRKFVSQFSPAVWDSSRAAIIESNLRLLDDLNSFSDPELADFVQKEKKRLSEAIKVVRQIETPFFPETEERFE